MPAAVGSSVAYSVPVTHLRTVRMGSLTICRERRDRRQRCFVGASPRPRALAMVFLLARQLGHHVPHNVPESHGALFLGPFEFDFSLSDCAPDHVAWVG
jgi:hypothetical protein